MPEQQNIDLSQKSLVHNTICGIEIDASGSYLPAADGAFQQFDNTYVETQSAKSVYFGRSSVSFSQRARTTRAGLVYDQQVKLSFPNGDTLSAERIREYIKVGFIYIKTQTGVMYLFGRNDYFQNTPPKIDIKNSLNKCEITFSCSSMFPIGNTNGSGSHTLPGNFPINFINL